ncbi:ribosomal protein S18-alanine N-acetyltransferase [Reinekea marinisedimentorum]|uniref:[Ribosomal protein bS18]-alanine N-acetyltransferase n=1 Tax=Reinekea marinisedimentorum TaxID=230495 RepID=A0A4R3HSL8_9GAMM|nr:ribosomal protein S18-alanine N-acetyltransferase [Reinekea marinisedimentorum]TCS36156.1 ribosomal-protein-alanine acetyltransferase [Reinekea marinisedimentorum]
MTLQPATERDTALIVAIAQSSDDSLLPDSAIAHCINQQQLMLVVEGGQPIGFIAEKIILDEAELLQVVIGADYRKSGRATEALYSWHQYLAQREVKQVFLEVREGNEAALRLYEKLGYTKIGVRKNYYVIAGVKYNALLMQKTLC